MWNFAKKFIPGVRVQPEEEDKNKTIEENNLNNEEPVLINMKDVESSSSTTSDDDFHHVPDVIQQIDIVMRSKDQSVRVLLKRAPKALLIF